MNKDTLIFVKVLIASGNGICAALRRALVAAEKWIQDQDQDAV